MGEKIDIYPESLQENIDTLKELLETCTTERKQFTFKGSGQQKNENELCYKKLTNVRSSLANLISATITCLEDFKDGYVDTDTYDAQQIQRFRSGSSSE